MPVDSGGMVPTTGTVNLLFRAARMKQTIGHEMTWLICRNSFMGSSRAICDPCAVFFYH